MIPIHQWTNGRAIRGGAGMNYDDDGAFAFNHLKAQKMRIEDMRTSQVVDDVVRRVSELPDRTSPEDWPDAMLVTVSELSEILRDAIDSFIHRRTNED
jgi:hypothetical protein